MKKKILASLIISLSLLSNQVQASAASAVGDYIAEHPEKLSKAKDVLKFGFKHSKTALILTGKAGLKTAEVVKDHPFLALTGVAAVTGIALLSVDNAVEQIADHPEALNNYLDKNPDKINKFVSKAIDKYSTSNDLEKDKYSNLLSLLLISPDGFNNSLDSEYFFRSLQDQKDLEKSKEFAIEYTKLESIANNYDKNNKIKCDIKIASLLVNTPPSVFYKTIRISRGLPEYNTNKAEKYNTDQYGRLKGLKDKLESDHIPSYKALELFFKKHNVSFTDPLTGKSLTKKKDRYAYLLNNATAVTIDYDLHRNNRTTYKNIFSTYDKDDLKKATINDYATILLLSKNNLPEYYYLLKSFTITYARNKRMCLYDL